MTPRSLSRFGGALLVVGLVASAFFVLQLVSDQPREPAPPGNGGVVQLRHDGLTISTTAVRQDADCSANDATGADIPLEVPSRPELITGGTTKRKYHVIAHSVVAVPPQAVTVTCTNAGDTIAYFVGDRAARAAIFRLPLLVQAAGLFGVGTLIAVTLIAVELIRRRRARS
ncbi:hypothetical protein E1263_36990 [Kribbella antibiotica]|uniref:Uncharacterized protein n=1 Tax=Kribbella antibiotica TaxID=190195 RepID=A0A4R4YRM0_9ACTN|nr:hypothetical protein [Kribbella antibiotica]TDD46212.1 hypothetical protein E1263_36990 [Kribbella antibiotica]